MRVQEDVLARGPELGRCRERARDRLSRLGVCVAGVERCTVGAGCGRPADGDHIPLPGGAGVGGCFLEAAAVPEST